MSNKIKNINQTNSLGGSTIPRSNENKTMLEERERKIKWKHVNNKMWHHSLKSEHWHLKVKTD